MAGGRARYTFDGESWNARPVAGETELTVDPVAARAV